MSRGAEAIIAAFESLPVAEREEVASELLRRVAASEHTAPSDEELIAAADHIFESYDRRETSGH